MAFSKKDMLFIPKYYTSVICLRHEHEPDSSAPETSSESQTEIQFKPDHSLCCAACLHSISSDAAKIELLGQHEHHFTNPHGHQFLIGCFSKAPGCQNSGDWLREHSWFPDYLWRYSLCSACQTHLGWQFRADNDSFYGLILARLVNRENLH